MKIEFNIIAHAKNHVFRLAEILFKTNNLNKIYTIYPLFKLREYKLNKRNIISLKFFAIIILLSRFLNIKYKKIYFSNFFDFLVSKKIKKDPNKEQLIIGLSGYCLKTIEKAKNLDYTTVVDRACPHILFQKNIIEEEVFSLPIKNKKLFLSNSFDQEIIDKMLLEYETCDYISVPSNYSARSFKKFGLEEKVIFNRLIPEKKIITNQVHHEKEFIIFAVGYNFIRKGFYYLIKAMEKMQNIKNIKLQIRSTIPEGIEMKIPDNVQIIDKHITNSELEKIYNKASIIALPSIDEGFGLSAIEAMSIGKPIIITKNVGMSDIVNKYSPELQNHILNIRDVNSIKDLILSLYEDKVYIKEVGHSFKKSFTEYISSNEPFEFYKKKMKF